jgi:hypothetical protein
MDTLPFGAENARSRFAILLKGSGFAQTGFIDVDSGHRLVMQVRND